MIQEAGSAGLNVYIWLAARQWKIDPHTIGRTWTVVETVESLAGSGFLTALEYANSAKPPDRLRRGGRR